MSNPARSMRTGTAMARWAPRRATALLLVWAAAGALVGCGGVQQWVSTQARAAGVATTPGPSIDRFATIPVSRLERGRQLRYLVSGTPGGEVTLEIPGVAKDVKLKEIAPGHYEGTYTIGPRDNLDAFRTAVVALRAGDGTASLRSDRAYPRERDTRPPLITRLFPREGEVVRDEKVTEVRAAFEDVSGVDPGSVRIVVSGKDVTQQARISADGFVYASDLPPGRHTVEVSARDNAGNAVRRAWHFNVGA